MTRYRFPSRRYVTVTTTQGLLQAEVVRTYLQSHGIPVILRYESAGRILGITVDGLGEVQVMVPSRWERVVRRLLRARRPCRSGLTVRRRSPPPPRGRRRRPTTDRSR